MTYKLFVLIFFFLFNISCRNPIPDPQSNDFIYQSLKAELSNVESSLLEREGQLSEFENKIKEADIQSQELRILRVKRDRALQDIRKLKQKIIYEKLKLLSREDLVRKSYLESFNRGEEWNSKIEGERYKKAGERLKASMSIPLKSNTEKSSDSKEKKTTKQSTGGH